MKTRTSPSVVGTLRGLVPHRSGITFDESLSLAELQASKLLELLALQAPDFAAHHISSLPRFVVTYERLPVSGMTHWSGDAWVIALSDHDRVARQRFTLLHEFKHILDHRAASRLYSGTTERTGTDLAEVAADYFAGCVLVPKRELKAVWSHGVQRIGLLADHFGVSTQAIIVRLNQTRINARRDPTYDAARCARVGAPQPKRSTSLPLVEEKQ